MGAFQLRRSSKDISWALRGYPGLLKGTLWILKGQVEGKINGELNIEQSASGRWNGRVSSVLFPPSNDLNMLAHFMHEHKHEVKEVQSSTN